MTPYCLSRCAPILLTKCQRSFRSSNRLNVLDIKLVRSTAHFGYIQLIQGQWIFPGLDDEQELHQYVVYNTTTPKGPKRINLDDSDKGKGKSDYTPPTSLTIHLSKIDMPELRPKPTIYDKHPDKREKEKGKKKGWRG